MFQSIEISSETKKALDQLRSKENYDQIITKLLKFIPIGDEEGEYTSEFRLELLNAKLEVLEGQLVDHEKIKETLGI